MIYPFLKFNKNSSITFKVNLFRNRQTNWSQNSTAGRALDRKVRRSKTNVLTLFHVPDRSSLGCSLPKSKIRSFVAVGLLRVHLLDLSVVDVTSTDADDNLVHMVGAIVHVLRWQTDCSRTWRANLKSHRGPVVKRDVQTDIIGTVRRNICVCRDNNIHVTDHTCVPTFELYIHRV